MTDTTQDPHATVIAADMAHDQNQVAYETGAAEESMECMFDMLMKRLDEAETQLNLMRARAQAKRDHHRAERNEARGYANTFLEQLGAVSLLLAKVGDGIDGVPAGKTTGAAHD